MNAPTNAPSPEDQKTANRLKAHEALSHLDALDRDPHFAWFLEHVLHKARDEEQAAALNMTLDRDKREHACWRHDLARELCSKSATLRQMHERTAGLP